MSHGQTKWYKCSYGLLVARQRVVVCTRMVVVRVLKSEICANQLNVTFGMQ